jgi:hypothetical protein
MERNIEAFVVEPTPSADHYQPHGDPPSATLETSLSVDTYVDGPNTATKLRVGAATRVLRSCSLAKQKKKSAGGKHSRWRTIRTRRYSIVSKVQAVVRLQKCVRGYCVRKVYGRRLKMSRHRKKVVQEILMSEKSYSSSLSKLCETAIVPLKWQCKHSQNQVRDIDTHIQQPGHVSICLDCRFYH